MIRTNYVWCGRFAREQGRFGTFVSYLRPFLLRRKLLELPFVELAITTRCTLECRDCSNLIPLIKDKYDLTFSSFKEQVDTLLKCTDYVYRFKVHGGEPFLHPNLSAFLDYLNSKRTKIGEIRISTNGTVIPNNDVFAALKAANVYVFVSGYPSNLSKNRRTLLMELERWGIRTRSLDGQIWSDLGKPVYHEYKKEHLQKLALHCSMANCKSLYNNRLYLCSRCSNGEAEGLFDAGLYAFLDVSNIKRSRAEIRKLYEGRSCNGCQYCNGMTGKEGRIQPAVQIRKKKQ